MKPKFCHINDMRCNLFFKLWAIATFSAVSLMPIYSVAQPSSVHSDLPLWTSFEDLWPRSFNDDDSFGCAGSVRLGNWKLTYFPESDDTDAYTPDPDWLKIHNYGVFHCAYGFRWAYEHENLEAATATLGHFVELGYIKTPRGRLDLWAIQIGFTPGSDYIFLTRNSKAKPDDAYEVLNIECPKRYLRSAGSIDVFGAEYCAINSKSAMRRLAKRMAKQAPIGKLEYLENTE